MIDFKSQGWLCDASRITLIMQILSVAKWFADCTWRWG